MTFDPDGRNLPERGGCWLFDRRFTLGIRDAVPAKITPEQVIRGIAARGHFVWRTNNPSRTPATGQ